MNLRKDAGAPTGQVAIVTEPALGGRCSSLRSARGREWFANRAQLGAARALVRPGDPFIDAGGFEECFPTIAGAFDHGEVWSQPWLVQDGVLTVAGAGYRLEREIAARGGAVVFFYRLEAAAGFRFIWAGHTSVALSNEAVLRAPLGARVRLWPDHWRLHPNLEQREGPWPAPLGVPLDKLAEDGSAVFAMLLDVPELSVNDGGDRLTFRLEAAGQPIGIAIWRNLGRWPEHDPYRSIAIEPAIGHHFDRDLAGAGEVGVVPASGSVEWRLVLATTDAIGTAGD